MVGGTLGIVPVGKISRESCKRVGEAVAARLGMEVDLLFHMADPEYARHIERGQYNSEAIVKRIGQCIDPKKHRFGLGVADGIDLFLPEMNFAFGSADRADNAALISLVRFKPSFYGGPNDPELIFKRATAEALFTVGHLIDLAACQIESCSMYQSNTLSDTDRKRPDYCETCKNILRAR